MEFPAPAFHQCRICLEWFEGYGSLMNEMRFCSEKCRLTYQLNVAKWCSVQKAMEFLQKNGVGEESPKSPPTPAG